MSKNHFHVNQVMLIQKLKHNTSESRILYSSGRPHLQQTKFLSFF
uniref:Uncharacterized protein n=1 Tax=Rhizophora mucronata TaxID=61149 RepID=A0A2P2QVP5_RHIMU